MNKTNNKVPQKLFFLRDLSAARGNQVYSGHTGTGKKFQMFHSDYGKYAMKPSSVQHCEALKVAIAKDAPKDMTFEWDIVPITEIDLCNFHTPEEHDAFEKLKLDQAMGIFNNLESKIANAN
jgi:hypothetical protein